MSSKKHISSFYWISYTFCIWKKKYSRNLIKFLIYVYFNLTLTYYFELLCVIYVCRIQFWKRTKQGLIKFDLLVLEEIFKGLICVKISFYCIFFYQKLAKHISAKSETYLIFSLKCNFCSNITTFVGKCVFTGSVCVFYPQVLFIVTIAMLDHWWDHLIQFWKQAP
jgi:hypothetical protein